MQCNVQSLRKSTVVKITHVVLVHDKLSVSEKLIQQF